MKGRDAAVVGAILVLAGFAAADALRGGDGRRAAPAPTPPATAAATETAQAPEDAFDPIPAPGRLVLAEADGCRIREVAVPDGRERPLPRLAGTCELWSPPTGSLLAYGLGRGPGIATPFRLVDLARPERPVGGYEALFGFLAWSLDGSRVAWCGNSRAGFDLDVATGAARRLDDCPTAYTDGGEVAFARGQRLVSGGRTLARAEGTITWARFARDGSLALVVDGRRLERRAGGRTTGAVDLPPELAGGVPLFSPDNCAALLVDRERRLVRLVDLGCFGTPRREARGFFGTAAAWSPDGHWIAVAERTTVAFHRVVGPTRAVRWPVAAGDLAWRSD